MATFVADNKEDADRVQELFNEVRLQNENQLFLFSAYLFSILFLSYRGFFIFILKHTTYLFVTILTEPICLTLAPSLNNFLHNTLSNISLQHSSTLTAPVPLMLVSFNSSLTHAVNFWMKKRSVPSSLALTKIVMVQLTLMSFARGSTALTVPTVSAICDEKSLKRLLCWTSSTLQCN